MLSSFFFLPAHLMKPALKLAATGLALIIVGAYFLLRPILYCTDLGQALVAMLAVLIGLTLVNVYLNIRKKDKKK